MDKQRLKQQLELDEGRVPYVYPDQFGYLTIGLGHLVDKRKGGKLSNAAIDFIFEEDVNAKWVELTNRAPWVVRLSDARQNALVNAAFQLGVTGLLGFKKAIAALQRGDFATAANEFLDSDWAKQTPNRAQRVAALIRSGSFPDGV